MATIVIAGGGVAGLATALAMARDRHRVVVLERGAAPELAGPAGQAGERWQRPAVPQAGHSHTLTSLGVAVLREHAPALLADLLGAGARLLDLTAAMPPAPRLPDDAELVALACRRTTFDVVLHRHVSARPAVEVRHRTRVLGLVTTPGGDRVAGVRTDSGPVPADLVIDATGRRALGRRWLDELGLTLPADLSAPTGTRAYARFYRRPDPGPLNRGNAAGVLAEHFAGVLHPGDGDTFSVAFGVLPRDEELRRLGDPDAFDAAARATPWVTDWMSGARPITAVRTITMPPNTLSALAVTPSPVAGLVSAGDAACVTDPIFGRGLSLALARSFQLAGLLRAHPRPDAELGRAAAEAAAELYTPWYQHACAEAGERIARWRAAVDGAPPPALPVSALRAAAGAAGRDPVVWRGVIRVLMGLRTPAEVFADESFAARVTSAGPPRPAPGVPTRAELLAITAREGSEHVHAARR